MQHDYVIDNAPGGTFRVDLNNALLAIASGNSGSSAPSTTYAYMPWVDTSGLSVSPTDTVKKKRRNSTNTAWIVELPDVSQDYGGLAAVSAVNTFTAQQRWTKGADIASATTLVLGTDGNYFDVTGTTTITGITVSAGTLFMLQFDGALTLTQHVTNLALPGGGNIKTAAGDRAICFAEAANQVRVLTYERAAPAAFSAHKNGSAQGSISDATATKITFGTEAFDVGGFFDAATNYRWTPPPGKVRLSAQVRLSGTGGTLFAIYIYKNGGAYKQKVQSLSSADYAIDITIIDDANGSDYYEVYAYMDVSSGSVTAAGAATDTFFMGHVI